MPADLSSDVPEDPVRDLAGILFSGQSTQKVLEAVAHLARTSIPACDGASLTLIGGGAPRTTVSSHPLAMTVDAHQYRTSQGPCLDAIREQQTVNVEATADHTSRWPAFTPLALAEGLRSSLSLPAPQGAPGPQGGGPDAPDDHSWIAQTFLQLVLLSIIIVGRHPASRSERPSPPTDGWRSLARARFSI